MSPAATNGSSARKLVSGVYVPVTTFFKDDADQSLDLETQKKHSVYLAQCGCKGIVVQGSTAEAVFLTREERAQITRATRQALDEAGFHDTLVISGCGYLSTKQTIDYCQDAGKEGADYVLVLPPSYYPMLTTKEILKQYYQDVAEASPIGVMVYNFPGIMNGVDMDSDLIIDIASSNKNIVGCKLTCSSVGKMTRIAATFSQEEFFVMSGATDLFISSLMAGAEAAITGMGNIAPKTLVKCHRLWAEGNYKEAKKLGQMLSKAEYPILKHFIPGSKYVMDKYYGYGGKPRRPLLPAGKEMIQELDEKLKGIMEYEKSL
ncbi:dihydrodipicolinate synthetase-like protein [Saitoella complicata NRRL Y-17804]|nr:dihydrodipicolinate synthetase-like protein [Saitoella complicata NRRL Y-17804]ODQ51099.1 dihydrodipicolinate synthetase-like protein [Saitoella complicata NRRL Y-17804]